MYKPSFIRHNAEGLDVTHKYEVVANGISQLISGSLSPHDALPSERELTSLYDVSRMTVRAAIAKLVSEGRVYKVHGSGTFVGSVDVFSKTPELTSFTEDMTARGLAASSRVLSLLRIEADLELSKRLGIPLGAECAHLRRLRLADDTPMAIEDVFLPRSIFDIDQLDLNRSLYEQLARAGHEIIRAEQEILAVVLGEEDAQLLTVEKGSAGLCVERITSSTRGRLVEFARTLYRADRYSFHLVVARDSE